MRLLAFIFAGIGTFLISIPAAVAQPAQWVEFPAAQSRVEFAVFGLQTKPSRGWELQGGGGSNNRVRNYQYLWGVPFQGKAAFGRLFLAQLTDATSYFTTQPDWKKMDTLPEFAKHDVVFASGADGLVKTQGLGSLRVRAFTSQGRHCLAFGGLTHAGSSSQLLYGEAVASGDTSVRGYYCAAADTALTEADIPNVMQALRFK